MKLRMPRKKTLAYVFLGLMVLSGVALFSGVQYLKYQFFNADPNTLTFNGELHSIPFEWVEVQFGDHVEPHYAMNVQVTIPGIPNKFYMQFDTGSPYTFFRSGAMDELRSHGADFELFERDDNTFVKKIELNIAANRVVLNSGKVNVRGATIDWDDPLAINIIGTIGADFLASKVVAIDFPAKRISLFEGRTPSLESLGGFTSFSFEGRRILLPVKIMGVDQHLFYDSGCSSFGLFTSKYHFDRFADPDGRGVSYDSNRHGDPIPVHHCECNVDAKFGEMSVTLDRVSYVEQYALLQSWVGGLVNGGVLGNECLTEQTLILDTQSSEYLIVNGSIADRGVGNVD